MAACKFSPVLNPPPDFTVKQSELSVTCKLDNPPPGVTIAVAELFRPTPGTPPVDLKPSGQSFVIPKDVGTGAWRLHVRVKGGTFPIPAIDVVEDCDASLVIMTITDAGSKENSADLEVLKS